MTDTTTEGGPPAGQTGETDEQRTARETAERTARETREQAEREAKRTPEGSGENLIAQLRDTLEALPEKVAHAVREANPPGPPAPPPEKKAEKKAESPPKEEPPPPGKGKKSFGERWFGL